MYVCMYIYIYIQHGCKQYCGVFFNLSLFIHTSLVCMYVLNVLIRICVVFFVCMHNAFIYACVFEC